MRRLTGTVLISFILILGFGIFSGNYSLFVSGEMQDQVAVMEEKVTKAQWTEAETMVLQMEQAWQQRGDILSMWVNHGDVDDVSAGLKKLRVAVAAREPFYTLLCAAEVKEALDHVYHRDSLRLKNIL